ncbi:MAG: SDR family NAD(P)-dependent oxidoreductase [Oceanicaulis sp.]|uniref:SDR family NAD(P)-dependent oxidoreductase n=1 Tax=Glycocaulis sp. TaxID=1969725 RepID=UPI0025BF6265|nr:SDR family NAD(P)-dependent oxidoreductase [Glycocaulis sp.]MCC5981310.1 SDR family NAD(P)-dependent oxidoreductase [Oceanicaulis sp.]MCH8520978.1 SDR family NAD(P)-dependent oxidoreductase [Glycocaulis sp.]
MQDLVRSAVVTGTSTGIGRACVEKFVAEGWQVFAGIRKAEDGERLKAEIGEAVIPLIFDVTDGEAVAKAGEYVREALMGSTLGALINNAGIAVAGPLLHLPVEEMEKQMDVNVTGQLRAVQAFAPLLGADRSLSGAPGRIVNISSVAGFSANPLLTPYSCSKFAMEAFTQGLRRELMMYGIDVVAINPGPIATPIWDKAEAMDAEQYAHTDYIGAIRRILSYMLERGRNGLPASRVADAVWTAITAKRPKLNTVITPEPFTQFLLGALPGRMSDRLITRRLGLTPEALAKTAK